MVSLGGEAQTPPPREAWQAEGTHTQKQVRQDRRPAWWSSSPTSDVRMWGGRGGMRHDRQPWGTQGGQQAPPSEWPLISRMAYQEESPIMRGVHITPIDSSSCVCVCRRAGRVACCVRERASITWWWGQAMQGPC